MFRNRLKTILRLFTIFLTLVIIGVGWAFWSLNREMNIKIQQKQFLRPTEFFAYPLTFQRGHLWTIEELEQQFFRNNYRSRSPEQVLLPGDFRKLDREQCLELLQRDIPDEVLQCLSFVKTHDRAEDIHWIFLTAQEIYDIWSPQGPISKVQLEPQLVAQYLGTEPLLQKQVELSDIPVACLNSVLAIEDQNFLEHSGFSVNSFLRAIYKNVIARQKAQGGSTITQQLVKNYFLTPEKTIKRKLQELIMAILLESRLTKDEILVTYLNIIYMGQNGPFRVHGFGAAANYYFNKELSDLNLSECALLAAVLNSPGLYNPWTKSENAKKRRSLVLAKMAELSYITPEEKDQASEEPLTRTTVRAQAQETAPYYLDAVRKFLVKNALPVEGVRIFTALDIRAQQKAQDALQNHLNYLEKNNKKIKERKEAGLTLEGAVLSGDASSGLVHVLVGGRNFRKTQFNRAIDGHRQVGSIMKPFVFLAGLMASDDKGPRHPLTLVNDVRQTYKYEGQSWTPENYGKKYFGEVPLYYALMNSLNAATARLGMDVGLRPIINVAKELGIESELKPVPSVTLGAFEIYPIEVLRSYMALSQMGRRPELSYVLRVEDLSQNVLYEFEPYSQDFEDPAAVASLVGMMKLITQIGTARAVTLSGFYHPSAGKTGTTSDYRDTWFAGFTPDITTVVWVGYDDNTQTGLTGSSGAVPIWIETMKSITQRLPIRDFVWPENTERETLSIRRQMELKTIQDETSAREIELVFKKGSL